MKASPSPAPNERLMPTPDVGSGRLVVATAVVAEGGLLVFLMPQIGLAMSNPLQKAIPLPSAPSRRGSAWRG